MSKLQLFLSKLNPPRNLDQMGRARNVLGTGILFVLFLAGCASSGGLREAPAPDKVQLRLDAAAAALLEGDPTGALQHLHAVEDDAQGNPNFFHVRALAYAAKKDLHSAISDTRRAIELDPQFSDARNSLGKFLIDQGKLSEAKAPLLRAARDPLYRDAFKSYTLLGIAQYRLGELDAARQSFASAVQSDAGRSCLAHYYSGHIFMKQGKINDALRSYEKSTLQFCASFADGQLAYGIALKRNGQSAQARHAFLNLRERFPKSPAAEQALIQLKDLP